VIAHVAAFRQGGQWLDELLVALDVNRRLLGDLAAEHLPGVRYLVPEATYMAWLDFRPLGLPADPAAFFLERARVALSPGPSFGLGGEGHARINFGTSPVILETAIRRMGEAVAQAR
jgi:cystathionine beta-lyase